MLGRIPHDLMSNQVKRRLTVATSLLSYFETEKYNFVSRIVAIDTTWVWSYESEMKRQATEWHTPNYPRPEKFRHKQGK